MTPSMRLSSLKRFYAGRPDADEMMRDLEIAFSLGHEFGVERAACVVDECNKEGPYNATGDASRIRALPVVQIKREINTIDKGFV